MMHRRRLPLLAALFLSACSQQGALQYVETGALIDTASPDTGTPTPKQPYNILFVVWDDVGVENFALYPEAAEVPLTTPTFDALAAEGLLFDNAWAYPVCSPTRASILTGRHPFRHGVGRAVRAEDPVALPYAETLLPEVLSADPNWQWRHAAIGKWHLGTVAQGAGRNPLLHGFDFHLGPLYNAGNYYFWDKNVNGQTEQRRGYLTANTVNDAKQAIDRFAEPWMLWVALNAPHAPYHVPPRGTYTIEARADDTVAKYRAMVESADYFTGQLLAHLTPEQRENTMIVVLGDNGTPENATLGPVPRALAKTTVYEGGVRVPMVIAGPAVEAPGRRTDALVHVTDLFPTALDWAGLKAPDYPIDGRSLTPLLANEAHQHHEFVYTELYEHLGFPDAGYHLQAIRERRYKLVNINGGLQFFDLSEYWLEERDLLAEQPLDPDAEAAFQRLQDALATYTTP